MDRRYKLWKILTDPHAPSSTLTDKEKQEALQITQTFLEGKQTEFWQAVTAEVQQQIRAAEGLFLDRMARNYEEYVMAWSRRQALIAVLAIPETPHATP